MEPGPRVIKYRPKRDASGLVVSPARIWLTSSSCPEVSPERSDAVLPVPKAGWWGCEWEIESGSRTHEGHLVR
jgi:hypothetical protein